MLFRYDIYISDILSHIPIFNLSMYTGIFMKIIKL